MTSEELKMMLRSRFKSTKEGVVDERFLVLWQWGFVKDYRLCFETLASPLKDMLERHFINKLRLDTG